MATITTINATDLLSASRAVINTNFSNLNTAKVDGATALTTAGRLVEVASSGVATQTSFASSVVVLTSGSYADPAWVTSLATTKLTGTLQAAQFPALTGDVTTSAGAVATTLANTAVTPASYGSASQVATFTVDSKGRLTAAASTSIAIAASQVTSGTLDNARTTAASTNTVSTIVARDASGNFAAGTITATFSGNLTGNVTGNASGTAATITGALALANTPLTTRGDLLVATTATPILGRLAKGTQYQVLLGGATDPTWGALDLSQASAITGILPVGNGGTGATTLAGAGIVAGAASITTANALLIGASAGVLGQSDATFDSGIFSRAGTVGLSATGANVLTFSTNGSERGRFTSGGFFGIGVTPYIALQVSNNGLQLGATDAYLVSYSYRPANDSGVYLGGLGATKVGVIAGQDNLAFWSYASGAWAERMRLTGNLLIGTTTDDGASKLQVAGKTTVSATVAADVITNLINLSATGYGLRIQGGSSGLYALAVNDYQSNSLFTIDGAGAATLYNAKAVTGVTSLVVRAGAGQSTTALQTWQNNAGTPVISVHSDASMQFIGTNASLALLETTGGAAKGFRQVLNNDGKMYLQSTVNGWIGASNLLIFEDAKISFFGVTPVARQTATADAASILALLQAYGLSN